MGMENDRKIDRGRFLAAAQRFRAFFEELRGEFIEREEVLQQVALALLAREHVLLTGPPGTAKSQVASGVFGRILCADSGAPSLYARQITESTVQTDLIGPVDFKNLMETGRTEHFTDEGMLGAHHAFLDEVFDGRDMLLRSALNVLQEREIKQGTRIEKGRIECALLTSNRYISSLLEGSRETLLAFVDRIAFIGFVPRGFARPGNLDEVLRRQLGDSARNKLDALLTLQDLDVLQAVVDRVYVSDKACGALAGVIEHLGQEIGAAVRADPTFSPTRYLSTRTAVRAGRVLRAAVVYDAVFRDVDRAFQVRPRDFRALSLHLVLAGPTKPDVPVLLKGDLDPAERRQLEILQTEREALERALARLPKIPRVERDSPLTEKVRAPSAPTSATAGSSDDAGGSDERSPAGAPPDGLTERFAIRIELGDFETLLLALEELTGLAAAGGRTGDEAHELAERAVDELHARAIRSVVGMDAHAAAGPDDDDTTHVLAPIRGLVELAEGMADTSMSLHALSHWLRERARDRLEELATFVSERRAERWLRSDLSIEMVEQASETRIRVFEELASLRERLALADAESPSVAGGAGDGRWADALSGVSRELAALWERAFCAAVEVALEGRADATLQDVLTALKPMLERLDERAKRLEALSGSPTFKRQALGARLAELVRGLLRRPQKRAGLDAQVQSVLAILADAELMHAIDPTEWLVWTATGLAEVEEQARAADSGAGGSAQTSTEAPSLSGYRELRKREERVPLSYVMTTMAIRVAPKSARIEASSGSEPLFNALASLPVSARARVAELDIARIERAVRYLETWWKHVSDAGSPEVLGDSGLLTVLWDEQALARFALEAQLLGGLLPEQHDATEALRDRLRALDGEIRDATIQKVRGDTDRRWQAALARSPA